MHLYWLPLCWLAALLGAVSASPPVGKYRYGYAEENTMTSLNKVFDLEQRWPEKDNGTWIDCNLPRLEGVEILPINNTWIVRMRLKAGMSPKEHAAWAQGLHDKDDVHEQNPRDLLGVINVYEDRKRSKGNGYAGQFTCRTKRIIEQHEDVLEMFQVVHDLRKMGPDLTPGGGELDD